MNWDKIKGNWKQAKGKMQAKWGELTDDDVAMIDGRREQLEGVLQERYGKAKEAVKAEVDAWLEAEQPEPSNRP